MKRQTLLVGGRIFTEGRFEEKDLLVEDGRVAKISNFLSHPTAKRIDLCGKVVSPGFYDLHAHFRQPGFSHKETIHTGSRAAAKGGFTTVCAMPNLDPVPDSLEHLMLERDIIARDACVEVLPYAAITRGEKGRALADIAGMAPHAVGFSDDGKGVQADAVMEAAMEAVRAVNGLISAHCEDESLLLPGGCVHDGAVARRFAVKGIPSESEWKQVERDIALARRTGVRYHVCHVSAKETVALIREAKRAGLPVTCECTPHQLMLSEEDVAEDDGRFKMNPPLRAREDREAIIQGLLDGTIDCIATDHAPHAPAEKAGGLVKSAFGVVGLETAFAVCYTALVNTGRCGLPLLLDRLAAAPAHIIGRSAALHEGAVANLTVLDTKAVWRVEPEGFLSMGRSTPFAGMTLTGRPVATWYRGENVYLEGGMG